MGLVFRTTGIQSIHIEHIKGVILYLTFLITVLISVVFSPIFFHDLFFDELAVMPVNTEVVQIKNIYKAQTKAKTRVKRSIKKRYSFSKVKHSFHRDVNLKHISKIGRFEIRKRILSSIPSYMRANANLYVDAVMELSEKYQIDPFWVLAIMWTESNFEIQARSPAGAQGLMQIMPQTKTYLQDVIKREGIRLSKNQNVELGIFYLKRLLGQFNNNFVHATVAYNMGPGTIDRWLRNQRVVGENNRYLERVREAYSLLTQNFSNS